MSTAIVCRGQIIDLGADGIVRATVEARHELDLADAKEAVAAIGTFCVDKRRPVLVDLRGLKSMSRDARNYFAGPLTGRFESAAALLIDSPLTRAIGNFFMGLNKPGFPTRLFTSEEDALAWLKGHFAE